MAGEYTTNHDDDFCGSCVRIRGANLDSFVVGTGTDEQQQQQEVDETINYMFSTAPIDSDVTIVWNRVIKILKGDLS